MNRSVLDFAKKQLGRSEIEERAVLEVGSRNVNGSLRGFLEGLGPSRYLGVDIIDGPGVDEICDIGDVVARFGESSFDVIISTEVIEHVRDWRTAVSNLKRAVRPQGLLFITTRSRGFHRHAWPQDWWRYELQDMETIFQDMTIEALESDPQSPGVFLKAAKPQSRWSEKDLSSIRLYSMVGHRRVAELSKMDLALDVTAHKIARFFLPQRLKETIKEHILREGS